MAVGITVDFYWYQVGTGDFFHSFFSTVAYNLEENNWGSRFPIMMNEFYDGVLKNADISKALQEMDIIERELKSFSPDKVVWDIEDLSQEPPWGDDISPDITDLSNYFVTSDGENLITIMRHAFEKGLEMAEDVCVTAI